MSKIRKAAVSGTFYPNKKDLLDKMLGSFLNRAFEINSKPKAIIAPHAGYIYSGGVAASAYRPLLKFKDTIKKVILLGPAHRSSFNGIALPASDFFETPLGNVKIDQKTIKTLEKLPQIIISDEAHKEEHSLEVHLPFLQKIFGENFELIPGVVGNSNAQDISELLEKLWGGDETLIIISTDLSHYHTYEEAYQIDRQTCQDVENLDLDKLAPEKMCGFLPVSGLVNIAKKKKLQIKMVDFCNSGDVIINDQPINRNRVVGYGAFYCGSKSELGDFLSKAHKKELINVALSTIQHSVENNYNPPEYLQANLTFNQDKVATFVTINIDGKLRGCIGALEAHRDILQDVAFNAYSAAFSDPRFPKLTEEELENIEISISILTKPEPLKFKDEKDLLNKIRPNIDGLILTKGNNKGTFLPSVWEDIKDKKQFLEHLKVKAGLKAGSWSDDIKIQRYETVKFSEKDF